MKRFLVSLLILVCIMINSYGVFAYSSENNESPVVVRVGYSEALGLMNGASPDAVKSGYVYDVLQEISKRTGWKYEYVYGDFLSLIEMLEKGEIDILPDVTKTKERERTMLFPNVGIGEENSFIAKALDNESIDIDDISTLNNKVIGVEEGIYQKILLEDFINANNLKIEIVEYPTVEEKWDDLQKGKIDLSLDVDTALTSNISCVKKLGTTDFYFAVSKNRPELLKELNDVQNEIYNSDPFLFTSLFEHYYSDNPLLSSLTTKEREWLRQKEVIRIGGLNNDIPYTYYGKSGNVKGVVPEIFEKIRNYVQSDIKIEWTLYDTSTELLNALNNKEIDIMTPVYHSYYNAEKTGVNISNTIMSIPMGMLYSNKKSIDDIKKIAVRGTNLILTDSYARELFLDVEIIICDSSKECISEVLNDDADGIIAHSTALQGISNHYLPEYEFVVFSNQYDMCVATRLEDNMLINIINKGILFISKTEISSLVAKHISDTDVDNLTVSEFLRTHPEFINIVVIITAMLVVSILLYLNYRKNRKKMLVDQEIIESLADDYVCVNYYLVDDSEDDGKVIEQFRTSEKLLRLIPGWMEEENIYERFKMVSRFCVYESEKEKFDKKTTREAILEGINIYTTYYVNFKALIDGKILQYQMRFFADRKENGDIKGIIVGLHNVDEEFKLEELYRKELEDAKEKAENANNAKTQFLFNMSHDIRTPMNAIKGFTDMAQKHIDDKEKVSDCLTKVHTAEEQLLKLINDILDLSKIESGKTEIENKRIDLRVIFNNCVSIIGGQLLDRDIELVTDISPSEYYRVLGDELQLRQVFINVLGNSVKFTNDGGKIFFSVRELRHSVGKAWFEFKIKDTGIGMQRDFLDHIWEPFIQEHESARTEYKGTGLGMSISKKLVTLMGGTIEVSSELNKGTEFTIVIPFVIDESEVNETDEDESVSLIDLNGIKILLAEDNELNQEIAIDILEDEGCIVTCASDGGDVVAKFRESKAGEFDIILMDIMMPVLNGYEATKVIRRMDRKDAATIPIIALSANAFSEDIKKSLEAGMSDHISKPINIDNLKDTIGKYRKER